MKKEKIDYEWHEKRHMCETSKDGDFCKCIYLRPPTMYVNAGECPRNPRLRPPTAQKVHVGQGKTKAGGNR